MRRTRQPIDESEKVTKAHFVDSVKENLYTCPICGSELWDERKKRLRYKATYRFRGRKSGDLLFACAECRTMVARIDASELSPNA